MSDSESENPSKRLRVSLGPDEDEEAAAMDFEDMYPSDSQREAAELFHASDSEAEVEEVPESDDEAKGREDDEAPPEADILGTLHGELLDFDSDIPVDTLEAAAMQLYERWVLYPDAYGGEIVSAAYKLFGMNRENGDTVPLDQLDLTYKNESMWVMRLYQRFYKLGIVDDDPSNLVHDRFKRVMEMMYNLLNLVTIDMNSRRCMDPDQAMAVDMDISKWEFRCMDKSDNNPFQSLLLHILEYCRLHNYRKYGGSVYSQVMTEPDAEGQRYNTHAWEEVMDFTKLVYECTRKESRYEQWLNFTSQRGIVGHIVDYLENCNDHELPELEPDRHIFSFCNGVYHAGQNVFYRYGRDKLDSSLVAAKYFDLRFPEEHLEDGTHFREIPTPNLDKIIDHQQIPTELNPLGEVPDFADDDEEFDFFRDKLSAKCWLLAFLGRLIYEVNSMDTWQCQLFLKGVAGSGKSTLGTLVTSLYNPEDVGVMSNNIEKQFGLAAFYKKLIYVCFEVKEDFGLDQGEFQSMISGEKMSIPRKFKDAISVLWTTPGLLMGNELAKWTDNSGSVSRRIIIMDFVNKVTRSDPRLHEKLMEEMPSIILKINLAYHTAAGAYGDKDIWAVLPEYYKTQKRYLRASTHPLASFFEFGPCECREGLEWDYDSFRDAAREYFRDNGLFLKSWGQDAIRTVFGDYGISDTHFAEDETGRRIKMLKGVGPV